MNELGNKIRIHVKKEMIHHSSSEKYAPNIIWVGNFIYVPKI